MCGERVWGAEGGGGGGGGNEEFAKRKGKQRKLNTGKKMETHMTTRGKQKREMTKRIRAIFPSVFKY